MTPKNASNRDLLGRMGHEYAYAQNIAESRGAAPSDISHVGMGVIGLETMIDLLSVIEPTDDITFGRMAVMLAAMVSEARIRALMVNGEVGLASMDELLKSHLTEALNETPKSPRKTN
jgi:hypothetical protein